MSKEFEAAAVEAEEEEEEEVAIAVVAILLPVVASIGAKKGSCDIESTVLATTGGAFLPGFLPAPPRAREMPSSSSSALPTSSAAGRRGFLRGRAEDDAGGAEDGAVGGRASNIAAESVRLP